MSQLNENLWGLGYVRACKSPDRVTETLFGRISFPGVLPGASIRDGGLTLLAMFIPKIGGGVNHGDVLYLFGRVTPAGWSK